MTKSDHTILCAHCGEMNFIDPSNMPSGAVIDADPEYTLGEVAEILGCSRRWLRKAVDSGAIRAYRLGNTTGKGSPWRVRRSDLEAFRSNRESNQ